MDEQVDSQRRPDFRYDIRTLLWVMAVIASSATLFPLNWLPVSGLVLFLWRILYEGPGRLFWIIVLGVSLPALSCVVLFPAVSTPREVVWANACLNNLRQIALALHDYHDVHGAFPDVTPVGGKAESGMSWRVAILPYLEEEKLYARLNLNEPWNSPTNAPLTSRGLEAYISPAVRNATTPEHTSYYAVVDERTAWRPSNPRSSRISPTAPGTRSC